jgi:hypothetical protein
MDCTNRPRKWRIDARSDAGTRLVTSARMTINVRLLVSASSLFSMFLSGCAHSRAQDAGNSEPSAVELALQADVDEGAGVAPEGDDDDDDDERDVEAIAPVPEAMLFADYGGRPELVIKRSPAEEMPEKMHVALVGAVFVASAELPVDTEAKERIWIHDRSGAVCPARLGKQHVRVRQPAEDVEQDDEFVQLTATELLHQGKVSAASIWSANVDDRQVTSSFTLESGRCEHPLFARTTAGHDDVYVASGFPVGAAERAAAYAKFAVLPGFQKAQAAFAEQLAELTEQERANAEARWDAPSRAEYTYRHFTSPLGAPFLLVSVHAGQACDPAASEMSALFEQRGSDLVLMQAYDDFDGANVGALVRVEQTLETVAGSMELIEPERVMYFSGVWGEAVTLRSENSVETPRFRCGC